MKTAFLLVVAIAISGCASVLPKGSFENSAGCTLGDKQLVVHSWWFGWLGIAAKIRPQDSEVACRQPVIILQPVPSTPG